MATGWLQINPQWIAGMFDLRATGAALVDVLTGKIQVQVEDAKIEKEGQMIEGTGQAIAGKMFLPTGWRPLLSGQRPHETV